MNKLNLIFSTFFMAAVLATSNAQALAINASFAGIAAGGNVYRNIDHRAYRLSGGQMRFNVNSIDAGLPQIGTQTLYGWCIEPFEGVGYNRNYSWEVQDLSAGATNIGGMGQQRANYLRELFYYVAPDFTQQTNATTGLALQIAAWEIVRDNALGQFDLSSGNARFASSNPSAAITLAQGWLNTYINDGVQGPMLNNVYAGTINGTQDMIFQLRTPDIPNQNNQVPLPAPVWLLPVGLWWLRRRRF